jgi:hypothetical protein
LNRARVQNKPAQQPKRDTKTEDQPTPKSVDIWSRVIAVVAIIMSLFTFALQFVAHEAVFYKVSQATLATWPKKGNVYFAVSMNVFNTGNRPAALVSATARLIPRKLRSDQRHVTDAECYATQTEQAKMMELFAGTGESPYLDAVRKYEASIEGGKLFTDNFIFRMFAENDKTKIPDDEKNVEGIVCLAVIFADAEGNIYPLLRALYGVHFQFEQEKFENIDADFEGGAGSKLVTVINRRRI